VEIYKTKLPNKIGNLAEFKLSIIQIKILKTTTKNQAQS